MGTINILKAEDTNIDEVSVEAPLAGVVVLDSGSLRIRKSPSTSAVVVGYLNDRDYVMIVGQSGDFYKVQYDINGNYGYVYKYYVTLQTTIFCYLVSNIDSGTLNMRAGAGSNYSIVASIPKDTAFALLSDDNDHRGCYYGLYGNKTGYTSTVYTRLWYF